MKNPSKGNLILALALLGVLCSSVACNEGSFSGSSPTKESADKGPAPNRGKQTPTDSDHPNHGDDGGNDGSNGPDSDGGDTDAGGTQDQNSDISGGEQDAAGAPGIIVTEGEADCLLRKADDFRVLLLFDNSDSTKKTDPSNLRRQAALDLAAKFADFIKANPTASAKMATAYFNNEGSLGSNGWLELTTETREKLDQDIKAATENPSAGTNFDDAMAVAEKALNLDGATAADKRRRTYIILLSDGQPYGGVTQTEKLEPMAAALATNQGAAFYSILIGKSPKANAIKLMQALAQPKVGIVSGEHIGTFVEAVDGAAIAKQFENFFKLVTKC